MSKPQQMITVFIISNKGCYYYAPITDYMLRPIAANIFHHLFMCRHEYHSTAQIISMACILHQCVQWFCHLPSSDKTEATLRHVEPNLTLVLTYDVYDQRSMVREPLAILPSLSDLPPISLLVNQWVYIYIWNGYLHSCGILCAVTCCFLHNVLRWCTGCIFRG